MADQETVCPPRCGYGLLGLCCTSCLLGPCRRSPFDDAAPGRHCGEDSDWIVSRNIMDRVSRESLRAMASLRDSLERPPGPGRRVEAVGLADMQLFLSPFFRGKSALLESIYPKKAFPFLHTLGCLPGSWSAALLDAAAAQPETRDSEARLKSSLRLAAITLAGEALLGELAGPAPAETAIELPAAPAPLLILVSDGQRRADDGRDDALGQIEAFCRAVVRIVRLEHVGQLPALGRAISDRWGVPASRSGSLAVVASPSMLPGMGALALGFSLASLPGYPIQGSPRVEEFLTRHLKEVSGHAYLALDPDEGLGEQILGGLTP